MVTRVCVVGSINLDLTYAVDALPRSGETVLASSVTTSPGGKGANQAVAAVRAGAEVRFVGAVGDDDAAAQLRGHLHDHGVDIGGLVTIPGRSGSAVVVVDSAGENSIVVAPEANGRLTVRPAELTARLSGCDALLLQLEIPVDVVTQAARAAQDAGVVVLLNASPSGGDVGELAELIDVLVVNEGEAARWEHPVAHRVVTLGARGARYTGSSDDVTVAAPRVDAVDTSGAGDVFAGVLAANWAHGPEPALRRACAAGALATLVSGAGGCAPDLDAIEQAAAAAPSPVND